MYLLSNLSRTRLSDMGNYTFYIDAQGRLRNEILERQASFLREMSTVTESVGKSILSYRLSNVAV